MAPRHIVRLREQYTCWVPLRGKVCVHSSACSFMSISLVLLQCLTRHPFSALFATFQTVFVYCMSLHADAAQLPRRILARSDAAVDSYCCPHKVFSIIRSYLAATTVGTSSLIDVSCVGPTAAYKSKYTKNIYFPPRLRETDVSSVPSGVRKEGCRETCTGFAFTAVAVLYEGNTSLYASHGEKADPLVIARPRVTLRRCLVSVWASTHCNPPRSCLHCTYAS